MLNIFISIGIPALFGLALFSSFARGIELQPIIKNGLLHISVDNIKYPKNIIEQDINSGLPNNISLIISLTKNGKQHFFTSVNYQITYDLWDEIYNVDISHANRIQKISFENSALLVEFITHLIFISEDILKEINTTEEYQLKAMVLVNPVKTERIKKIRAWIATSQGYTYESDSDEKNIVVTSNKSPLMSSGQVTANEGKRVLKRKITLADASLGRPRFQKLFDQILDQYMDPDEIPALWRSEQVNLDITKQSLINEK